MIFILVGGAVCDNPSKKVLVHPLILKNNLKTKGLLFFFFFFCLYLADVDVNIDFSII